MKQIPHFSQIEILLLESFMIYLPEHDYNRDDIYIVFEYQAYIDEDIIMTNAWIGLRGNKVRGLIASFSIPLSSVKDDEIEQNLVLYMAKLEGFQQIVKNFLKASEIS